MFFLSLYSCLIIFLLHFYEIIVFLTALNKYREASQKYFLNVLNPFITTMLNVKVI